MGPLRDNTLVTLVRKDLLVEARTRELFGLTIVLAVLILIIFRAAFEVVGTAQPAAPVLWVTLVLASVAGLARGFHSEADHGTLDALIATPAGAGRLFLGKTVAGSILAVVLALVTLVLAGVLIDGALLSSFAAIVPMLVLGAIGLASASALVSGVSARANARAALLPVLALPLCLPLLLVAVPATQAVLSPFFVSTDSSRLLAAAAAYDALVIAVGYLIMPRALEA